METKPLLKVDNLSVILDGKKILENISFEIFPEQVLAVIGPNGSGKSVLLKTLLGILPKAGGEIIYRPKTRVGYLPQRFQVDYYLPMTVREFWYLKPNPYYCLADILKLINADKSWLDKNMANLSSGQLQKVLLGWTLLDRPHLLFFDEPTENVDVIGQDSIYTLLHHLQDQLQMAIIIVSHDLQVVYRYAEKVLCLNKTMVCYGEPRQELTTEKLSELYGDHAFFHHHHYQAEGFHHKHHD